MTPEYLYRGALHVFRGLAVPLDGGWQQHFDLPAERVVPAPRRGMNGRQGRAATRRIDDSSRL